MPDRAARIPSAPVALSSASVYPDSVAAAFGLAARLGYDGLEVMVMPDPVSREAGALLALSYGPAYFGFVDYIVTSWLGDLILLLSTWALWYHSLAGLRHLIWDTGRCLEIEAAERLGKLVIAGSVVLTLITIILV